jgi:hypothetical protein
LESSKCNTNRIPIITRASHAATGNQEEKKIQPIRNKGKVKDPNADWSESEGRYWNGMCKLEDGKVPKLFAHPLKKLNLNVFSMGCLGTSKFYYKFNDNSFISLRSRIICPH